MRLIKQNYCTFRNTIVGRFICFVFIYLTPLLHSLLSALGDEISSITPLRTPAGAATSTGIRQINVANTSSDVIIRHVTTSQLSDVIPRQQVTIRQQAPVAAHIGTCINNLFHVFFWLL